METFIALAIIAALAGGVYFFRKRNKTGRGSWPPERPGQNQR